MHKSALLLILIVLFSNFILSTQHHFIFSMIREDNKKSILYEFITQSTIEIEHDGNTMRIDFTDQEFGIPYQAEFRNIVGSRLINSIAPSNLDMTDTKFTLRSKKTIIQLCKAIQKRYYKTPKFLC